MRQHNNGTNHRATMKRILTGTAGIAATAIMLAWPIWAIGAEIPVEGALTIEKTIHP